MRYFLFGGVCGGIAGGAAYLIGFDRAPVLLWIAVALAAFAAVEFRSHA